MRYHNITTDDMKNGNGLRVVLWVAGCSHHCKGCHNPVTWNPNEGIEFNINTLDELILKLDKDYIDGLTISGGDPLFPSNVLTVLITCQFYKYKFPNKTLWIYTGYKWEDIINDKIMSQVLQYTDVLVDGKFIEELADIKYKWAGSTNQRIIDVQKSIMKGEVILYETI